MKKEKLKWFQKPKVMVALIAVLAVLAGAGYFLWKESRYLLYKNAEHHFQMKYPRGWELKEGGEGGAVATFLSPQESDLDVFRENVTVTVENLGPRKMILREYAATAIHQLRAVFKDVKIIESDKAFFAGKVAHKIVYTMTVTYPLKIMHLFIFQGQNVYMFTYTAEAAHFDDYLEKLNTMMGSYSVEVAR
jgi:hypothetical protein